jgi:hypothetical protein
MQNHQNKAIDAPASSSESQLMVQTNDDTTEKKGRATTSAEQVMPVHLGTTKIAMILPVTYEQDNRGSGGSEPTEGNMTWHMERWLNEKTGESAWSVHGRF